MNIVIHGEAVNGRAVGRPRTLTASQSSRDPVVAARLARAIAMKGEWRTLPHRDIKRKILAAVAAEANWAALALPPEATELLPALGKDLRSGCCHWGAAAMQQGTDPPRTPVLLALLGNGCAGCQKRWREAELTVAAAREEKAYLDPVAASGASVAGAIRGLENARRIVGQAGTQADTRLPVKDAIRLARQRYNADAERYRRPTGEY